MKPVKEEHLVSVNRLSMIRMANKTAVLKMEKL
jgi:hypothetical protein